MTQEEKQLLLKDLCARLPYGVKAQDMADESPFTIIAFDGVDFIDEGEWEHRVVNIKPYLRPMSSMTEEERKMFKQLQIEADEAGTFEGDMLLYDWLNKNHFDYRLLIFQGLALEAKEGMYGKI